MNWSYEFTQVAQAIAPFAAAALTAAIGYGANWLRKHTAFLKSRLFQTALATAQTLASQLVQAAEQTVVKDLKTNGKWTAETAQDVKASVLEQIKTLLPADVKTILGTQNLDTLLSALIEQEVGFLRPRGGAA